MVHNRTDGVASPIDLRDAKDELAIHQSQWRELEAANVGLQAGASDEIPSKRCQRLCARRGIWAAAMTPFNFDLSLDEDGYLRNMRQWVSDLKIDGLFSSGKQGEFSPMSFAERKRSFELAVEATKNRASTIMSCSDQNIETVIELAKYAQKLGWEVYLCSTPPHLMQTKTDLRMREYTDLAMRGDVKRARIVRNSLDPVRAALKETRPPKKPQAHQEYWQELLGQVGGPIRRPQRQLADSEKVATRAAFENCGLRGRRRSTKLDCLIVTGPSMKGNP
jgi:dihydrodipicolinate synthase/N-acetylneuraminate lyase